MPTNGWSSWLAAWRWSPLVVMLTLQWQPAEVVYLAASWLIIPVACHLGLHYGKAGLLMLALMASPLLGRASVAGLSTTGAVDLYLSALLLTWWLHRRRTTSNLLPRWRLTPWFCLLLLVLPLQLDLGSSEWFGEVRIWWRLEGFTLFLVLLVAAGASRMPVRPVIGLVMLATVTGLICEWLDLPDNAAEWMKARLQWLSLGYRLDTPSDCLTALGYFLSGRLLADQYYRQRPSVPGIGNRAGWLLAVALLAFGGQLNSYLTAGYQPALHWLGSFYAVLLAGLLAGFWFRFAGILALLLAAVGFWWFDGLLRAGFDWSEPRILYRFDSLFYLYGFGLLGIRIRDWLEGGCTSLWSAVWFRFLLVYLLLLLGLVGIDDADDLILILLAFFAGCAFCLALGWVRDRLTGRELVIDGHWLSLGCLCMAAYLIYGFIQGTWQHLQQLWGQTMLLLPQFLLGQKLLQENELLTLAFVCSAALFALWLLSGTLTAMLVSATELIADLRAIWQNLRHRGALVLSIGPRDSAPARPRSKRPSLAAVIPWLVWFNRLILLCVVLVPVALIGYQAWLESQA